MADCPTKLVVANLQQALWDWTTIVNLAFVREDGQPMAFLMGPTRYERQEVKVLVEAGGGVVLNQPTLQYRDFVIRLPVRINKHHNL